MLPLIAATATCSGLVAALLPTIQIAAILRARSSGGISIPYLAGGLANTCVWTVYAFAFRNVALIAPNVLGLAMNVTMLVIAVRFRPRAVYDDELTAEFAQLLAEARVRAIA